jgi:hypothetical protein
MKFLEKECFAMNSLSGSFRIPLFFTLACLSMASAIYAQPQLERDFDVSPGGLLTIQAEGGSIEVNSSESDSVFLQISPQNLDEFEKYYEVQFQQDGNNVHLEIESKKKVGGFFSWGRKRGYLITALVPSRFNIDVKTSGGNISVADLKGEVQTETSGGNLTFGNVEGDIVGKTSGGNIDVGEVYGNARLGTSGGSITVKKGGADLVAKTSGGNIFVAEVAGSIHATTSGGSVKAVLTSASHDCLLSTSGGNVNVKLAADLGFQVNASTSGGRVTLSGMAVQGEISKRKIKGRLNQGGPDLTLKTSGGSIRIESM